MITPSIPDFYFDHRVAVDFRTGNDANLTGTGKYVSFLFTMPFECNGTVTAIQSCYQIKNGSYDSVQYLKFQVFTRNGSFYNATETFNITAKPSISKCNRTNNRNQPNQIVCCETTSLETKHSFSISSLTSFTYGITLLSVDNVRLLRISKTYFMEQYRFEKMLPEMFSLSSDQLMINWSALLLRLIVRKYNSK